MAKHVAHTIRPAHGQDITLTSGYFMGRAAVAMFVGRSRRPIILTKREVGALGLRMMELIEGRDTDG